MATSKEVRSLLKKDLTMEFSLAEVNLPELKEGDVLVRVEAAPVNPTDLGLMLSGADRDTFKAEGRRDGLPCTSAKIPKDVGNLLANRYNLSLPIGTEGAGVVVKAGSSEKAQALLGRVVGIVGGTCFAQYKVIAAKHCMVYPEGVTPIQGASWSVNPLTALAMVETVKMDGQKAFIHTAAASNLGQMLNRVCQQDGIDLVNIVRKPEQEAMLRGMGCKYVIDSSRPDWLAKLYAAVKETGARIAFDAIGGGLMASKLLEVMEFSLSESAAYSHYGSSQHKKVYIYGMLQREAVQLDMRYGMDWSVSGWLLTLMLKKLGSKVTQQLRKRVADEITTTFKSGYTREVSLEEFLDPEVLRACDRMVTGEKFVINPWKGASPSSKL